MNTTATTMPTTTTSTRPLTPGATTGVVLMAYGTPETPADIEPYYTDIRRGRPPTPEALAELTSRYAAIGGISPLAQRTAAQRDAVQRALDALSPNTYQVTLGLKHAEPKIETAVEQMAGYGFRRLVGAVLAPHYSEYSTGQYLGRLAAAAEPLGLATAGVRSWAADPAYIEFIANDLAARRDTMSGRSKVLFTAHSLPQAIIDRGDPYPTELRRTAEAVADRLGLIENDDWQLAWQSAGRTAEPWVGPDILAVIDDIGQGQHGRYDGVIVSAVGFVADHLEVLYDLDIEAKARADEHALGFARTACVNDDAAVMGALARRIHDVTTEAR